MRKFFIFLIVAITTTSIAMADNLDKLSAGTQMFISERDGKSKLPKLKQKLPVTEANDTMLLFTDENLKDVKFERKIAEPEMVNGINMVSAFVKIKGGGFGAIEGMGAVMQTKFNDGLAAMLLPVDKIEKIADLSNVVNIEVAEILEPVNDRQRSVTQAIDAITNSDAAKALGITSKYTGKGIILGIIDTGVDFQHIAFKDKNGNNRIVRAYKLSSSNSTSLTTYSTATQINNLTYDTNDEDHGTHTSSTAGGSSVIVNGDNVTVTDDHANATYGGMAPEADLVIAGLSSLYTTSIGTAIQNICNYADQVGKPCVISLSLGSHAGPHDGTGTIASIVDQCAGNNHIIVYAASNDAMRPNYFVEHGTSNGGGMYASGTSTSNKPMMANLQRSWADASGNVQLYSSTIHAYARSQNVATALKFHVVDTSTGNIVYSSSAYTSGTTISITSNSGLGAYFYSQSGYYNPYGDNAAIRIVRSTTNNKYYWTVYTPVMVSRSYSKNSSGIYDSKYALCVSVYPTSGSSIIDMWEGSGVCWFGNDLTLSSSYSNSYNLVQGNDECSVSDNACYSKVISVGAYVTRNSVTNYAGTVTDASEDYPNIGDHASFSSWQTAGYGPLGTALPHINAPGARIIAGINHYHTTSVDDYSYYGSDYNSDLIVNSSSNPYAAMEGTSMATPCVSGIIAQWLQACVEAGKTPSPDYIKEVMQNTWDTDQWTNGAGHGANTFGTHGKINAIKGIQYILGCSSGPVISASPESLTFSGNTGETYTKTVTVTGTNLRGNISATISGTNSNMFSVEPATITASQAAQGYNVTVKYSPTAADSHSANLVLTSTGADQVTVPLTGTATTLVPRIIVDKTSIAMVAKVDETVTQTFNVKGENLKGAITVSLYNTTGNAFSTNGITSISVAQAQNANGYNITVTYHPSALGTYSGYIRLTSNEATTVDVQLNGTVLAPEVISVENEVTLQTKFNGTVSKTFTVMGENLVGPVTATLSDANGVFSINPTNITIVQAESENGYNVTVTFHPTATGITSYTGSVTLTSNFAQSVTVNLKGEVMTPVITVDNDAIEIWSGINRTGTATFNVKGQYLAEGISLAFIDNEDNVFAIDKESITIEEAESNDGCNVTLTFSPIDDHLYYGGITLNSSGAEEVWIVFTGKITEPTLVADESLSVYTKLNGSKTETFSVMGECLAGPVTLTLNDENNVFSLGKTSISIEEAEAQSGFEVPVTFEPKAFVDDCYTATVTLSTPYHDNLIVQIKGYVNEPQLTADPELLTFSSDLNTSFTKSIEVLGTDLIGDVSVTLDDPSGVFSIDKQIISVEEAEDVAQVNVTFASATEGTYTGSVTFTTEGVNPVVVELSATANDGGTASDNYLNIAKSTTIEDAGWNTSYVNTLYKYTEYESNDMAWLTLPIYGAWSSSYYTPKAQKWITSSSTGNYQTAWSSTTSYSNPFYGSTTYFTGSNTARAMGSNSGTNRTKITVNFFVTNCSAVKVYGSGRNGSSTRYPAALNVYKCTKNQDGTLSPANNATKSQTTGTTKTFNLTADGLDVADIYKVEVSIYRGALYEIAFQTPLPQEVTLAQIVNDPSVVAGKQYRIVDDNLIGAYLSNDSKYIFCKDDNGYAEQMPKGNKVDFMTEHGWHNGNWDQSNWIVLNVPAETDLTQSQDPRGHKLSGVRGTLINKVNPTLQLTKVPTPGEQATVNFNTYLATDFDPEMLALTENYFFLPTKPMEVANVMWAMWDAASGKFVVASPVNNSTGRIDGAFYADLTKYYNDPSHPIGEIKDGYVYNFTGFAAVNVNGVSASTLKGISTLADETPGMVVYPLANWELKGDSNIITAINGVYSDGYREVVGVEYVNAAGLTSDKPFKGVNIVVTRYSDGSRTTVKKLYR